MHSQDYSRYLLDQMMVVYGRSRAVEDYSKVSMMAFTAVVGVVVEMLALSRSILGDAKPRGTKAVAGADFVLSLSLAWR